MSEQSIKDYKDLLVWQKGMNLAKHIYALTRTFPSDEKFGLVSQMRRAAISIPSNIAEGQARKTTGEFLLFLSHAQGSLAELDTQVLLSVELGFIPLDSSRPLSSRIFELQKMLTSLRAKLSTKHRTSTTDHP